MDRYELPQKQRGMVTPFNPDFESFLDPKIAYPVLELINRNFMPMYSCEGHSLTQPRYIDLAFISETQLNDFLNNLKEFLSPFPLYFELKSTLTYEKIKNEEFRYASIEYEIMQLNNIFNLKADKYFFVRIILGWHWTIVEDRPVGPLHLELMTFLKRIKIRVLNFLFREEITKQLVDFCKTHPISKNTLASDSP